LADCQTIDDILRAIDEQRLRGAGKLGDLGWEGDGEVGTGRDGYWNSNGQISLVGGVDRKGGRSERGEKGGDSGIGGIESRRGRLNHTGRI